MAISWDITDSPWQERDGDHPGVRPQPGQEGARAEGGEEEGGQAPDPDAAAHGRHVPPAEEEGQRRVLRERHHLLQELSFHLLFVLFSFLVSLKSCTFTRLRPCKNVTISLHYI